MLFAILILTVLGVFGLYVGISNIFPFSASSTKWVFLAAMSLLPFFLFAKVYIEIFHPGAMTSMSVRKGSEPAVIYPDVGADLKSESAMPSSGSSAYVEIQLSSQPIKVDINPPHTVVDESSEGLKGFLVKGVADKAPFILLSTDTGIEVWSQNSEREAAISDKRKLAGINDDGSWNLAKLVSATPITDTKVMLAIKYWNPTPNDALYLFNVLDETIFPVLQDGAAQNRDREFFQVKHISPKMGLVLYYSGRVRAAAELYYNSLNHIMLVSSKYPNGIDLLQLGIELGNVHEWQVRDNKLFIKAVDIRDSDTKESFWSLDIGKVLQ
ncbi:hypothetical protein [Kaarinaea lacus]